MGASTTFCGEVSTDSRTWPSRLERLLQEAYPRLTIRVVIAGVSGYTTEESVKNLEGRVLPLDPDIVVVYHANNDMARDTRRAAEQQGVEDGFRGPGVVEWLSRFSLLVDLAYKNVRIAAAGGSAKLDRLPDDLTDRFVANLERIRSRTAEADVDLVLSTFLVKYRRDQDPQTLRANADVAFYYMPWMTADLLLDALDRYNEAVLGFAEAHGIPVVDDRNRIPADAEHYVDCMHLTDAGCEAMARRFAEFFFEQGLINKRARRAAMPNSPVK